MTTPNTIRRELHQYKDKCDADDSRHREGVLVHRGEGRMRADYPSGREALRVERECDREARTTARTPRRRTLKARYGMKTTNVPR